MKRKCLFLLVAGFLLLGVNAYSFDLSYDFDLEFLEPDIIKGKETIIVENTTNSTFDHLLLRTYPNRVMSKKEQRLVRRMSSYFKTDFYPKGYNSGYLQIKEVTSGSRNLSFSYTDQERTILKIDLPSSLYPGEKVELTLDFETKVPLRRSSFGRLGNIVSLYYWYPVMAVFKDGQWHTPYYYVFHNPYFTDASSYTMKIDLPLGYKLLSSGKEVSYDASRDDYVLKTDKPVRDFGMVIFKDLSTLKEVYKGVEIKVSYPEKFYDEAEKMMGYIKDALDFFGEKFGQYPYSHFNAAVVNLGYAGNESSCLIMLDTRLFDLPRELKRYQEMLVVHETGHQWFYNIVGNNQFTEMFLDEGLNSLCTYFYMVDKYGQDAEILELSRFLDLVLPNVTFFRASLERYMYLLRNSMDQRITSKLSSMMKPADVFAINYSKAMDVLYMLYSTMGHEEFFQALEVYVNDFYFKNSSTDGFRLVLERVSGRDFERFFRKWIYEKGYVDYSVKKTSTDKFVVKNLGENFVPLDVKSGQEVYTLDNPGDLERELDFEKRVVLDPDFKVIEKDKVNNVYPRRVKVSFVPVYVPLYQMGLFQDPYAYNLIHGPYMEEGPGYKVMFSYPYRFSFYASSVYDIDDSKQYIKGGGSFSSLFDVPLTLGFDFARRFVFSDDAGEGNRNSWDVYLNYDLSPAAQSIFLPNEHVVFYLLHNQAPAFGWEREILALNHYFKNEETVTGFNLFMDSMAPYPFPTQGMRFFFNFENATRGIRSSYEYTRLQTGIRATTSLFHKMLTGSLKVLGGWSPDENEWIFSPGGPWGMRGYGRKDLQCSRFVLSSLDLYFPLIKDKHYRIISKYLHLNGIYLNTFFDYSTSGYENFRANRNKKDTGVGLNFELSMFSFVEKGLLRVEYAWPIGEEDKDSRLSVKFNILF